MDMKLRPSHVAVAYGIALAGVFIARQFYSLTQLLWLWEAMASVGIGLSGVALSVLVEDWLSEGPQSTP